MDVERSPGWVHAPYRELTPEGRLTDLKEIVGICTISRADWVVSVAPRCHSGVASNIIEYHPFLKISMIDFPI
jgi:hypothetical protein